MLNRYGPCTIEHHSPINIVIINLEINIASLLRRLTDLNETEPIQRQIMTTLRATVFINIDTPLITGIEW